MYKCFVASRDGNNQKLLLKIRILLIWFSCHVIKVPKYCNLPNPSCRVKHGSLRTSLYLLEPLTRVRYCFQNNHTQNKFAWNISLRPLYLMSQEVNIYIKKIVISTEKLRNSLTLLDLIHSQVSYTVYVWFYHIRRRFKWKP